MKPTTPEKCPKCGADFIYHDGPDCEFPRYNCWSTIYADGRFRIQGIECVHRQRDQLAERVKELESALSDPATVWANMLRGTIAMPPHIPELEGRLTDAHVRIQELEAALDLVVPTCEHLHHEKKYRHFDHEPCPVREIVMKAKGLK